MGRCYWHLQRDVKAFLFVLLDWELTRAVKNGGAVILKIKIRKKCDLYLRINTLRNSSLFRSSCPAISRSKNGVAPLAYVPGISIHRAMPCRLNRDCRDKRGNDEPDNPSDLPIP
jgi:hypothetical protein